MTRTVSEDVVHVVLEARWRSLQDGFKHPTEKDERSSLSENEGMLLALYQVGLLSDLEVEGWKARWARCPEGGPKQEHDAGRVWCAYCGNVKTLPDWGDEEVQG